MKGSATSPPTQSTVDTITPGTCPFCRSSSIVTKTKSPDADTYWRCLTCGEIWNGSRSVTRTQAVPRWR